MARAIWAALVTTTVIAVVYGGEDVFYFRGRVAVGDCNTWKAVWAGKRIVTGDAEGRVIAWELEGRTIRQVWAVTWSDYDVFPFLGDHGSVQDISVCGGMVAAISEGFLYVIDVDSGRPVRRMRGGLACFVNEDGAVLCARSCDNGKRARVVAYPPNGDSVLTPCFSGSPLLVGQVRNRTLVVTTAGKVLLLMKERWEEKVGLPALADAILQNGHVYATDGKTIFRVDPLTGKMKRLVVVGDDKISRLSACDGVCAYGTKKGAVVVLSEEGNVVMRCELRGSVWALAISPDSKRLFVCCLLKAEAELMIISIPDGKVLAKHRCLDLVTKDVRFSLSPDARRGITWSSGGVKAFLWDVRKGCVLGEFNLRCQIRRIIWRDAQTLLVLTHQNELMEFKLDKNRLKNPRRICTKCIEAAVSPSGDVACLTDGGVLWEQSTGERLFCNAAECDDLAFSPDGSLLLLSGKKVKCLRKGTKQTTTLFRLKQRAKRIVSSRKRTFVQLDNNRWLEIKSDGKFNPLSYPHLQCRPDTDLVVVWNIHSQSDRGKRLEVYRCGRTVLSLRYPAFFVRDVFLLQNRIAVLSQWYILAIQDVTDKRR